MNKTPHTRPLLCRTEMEEDYGHPFSDEEWETVAALESIARNLADHCCSTINQEAHKLPLYPIKYNAQWTLEKLISILNARV